ncbi:MAG: hypothetical protein J1F02_10190, partial [Lachnospiraceae bacterium]|nr:hypothetical protein [Lachnospiraceae bacterium]
IRLQLKLDGSLPLCYSEFHSQSKTEYSTTPHPVSFIIDNVSIVSGNNPVISLSSGSSQTLELDTFEGDTVEYSTYAYLAQYTHNGQPSECTRFNTIPASVDNTGLITANTPGQTTLIAKITHQGGNVERKQCIVQVE